MFSTVYILKQSQRDLKHFLSLFLSLINLSFDYFKWLYCRANCVTGFAQLQVCHHKLTQLGTYQLWSIFEITQCLSGFTKVHCSSERPCSLKETLNAFVCEEWTEITFSLPNNLLDCIWLLAILTEVHCFKRKVCRHSLECKMS